MRRRSLRLVALVLLLLSIGTATAYAASTNVSNWLLPAGTGNAVLATEFVTTAAEANITVKITFNRDSQDIDIWPVKCADGSNISGPKRILGSQTGQWITIATNVLDGTCFKLKAGAVGLTDNIISLTVKY